MGGRTGLADRIRAEIRRQGLTKRAIARAVGMHEAAVGRFVNGVRDDLKLTNAEAILNLLQFTIAEPKPAGGRRRP